MGKAIKGAGSAGNTALGFTGEGALMGKGPIADALGLSGAQGEYFQGQSGNQALTDMNARDAIYGQNGVTDAISGYGSGNLTLAQALNGGGLQGVQRDAMSDALSTNGLSGSRMASDFVNSDQMLGRLYGSGQDSALSRALSEDKQLAGQGYNLQASDHDAYGQASGNIARMAGQQEQGLAQALANRGLSQGASGAAGAAFSGLQGNKFEQLAASQRQIADSRMQNTLARRNALQSQIGTLGGQAQTAIKDQYGRQLQGAQFKHDNLASAAGLQNQQNQVANQAGLASMQDKRDAKGRTLLEGFGQGLMGSAGSIGQAPGTLVSSAAGSAGAAAGKAAV